MEISIEYHLETEDFEPLGGALMAASGTFRAARLGWACLFVLFVLGFVVSVWASPPTWGSFTPWVAVIMIGLTGAQLNALVFRMPEVLPRLKRRAARRLIQWARASGGIGSSVRASFDTHGVRFSTVRNDVALAWDFVRKVKDLPEGLWLELAPGPWPIAVYVPSRAFGSEAAMRSCAEFCAGAIGASAPDGNGVRHPGRDAGAVPMLLWAAGCAAWWWTLLFAVVGWLGGPTTLAGASCTVVGGLLCWAIFHAGMSLLLRGGTFDLRAPW